MEIYQTDSAFPSSFHTACYFMSIIKQIVLRLNMPQLWNRARILEIYSEEQIDNDILPDLTVSDPQGFCNHVAGGEGKIKFLGKFGADYSTAANEFEILCYHLDGNNFDHFCDGDGNGKLLYDPWKNADGTGSRSARFGELIGKRIFRIL